MSKRISSHIHGNVVGYLALFVALSGTAMASGASSAAAITIGQVSAVPAASCSGNGVKSDWVQGAVPEGVSYVVPPGGTTITSWSTNTSAGANQYLGLKIFRPTSTPGTFTVVAHDPPHLLPPAAINTFSVSIPVQPGDVLGLHIPDNTASGTSCDTNVATDTEYLIGNSDLQDGQSAAFGSDTGRLNVSAQVMVPSATPTGDRAAALASCKKRGRKHHWPHKRLKRCKRSANLLPA